MGIFDTIYGFLSKYVFSNAKLIFVMVILLMLYKIDITSKRNEELNHKLEVINVELKGKDEKIKLLEEKAATQDQLITNYKQSETFAKFLFPRQSKPKHRFSAVFVLNIR